MVVSLYIMTVCFWINATMQSYGIEKVRMIVLLIGIVFFWIANGIYDRTINKLKNDIRDLKKEIDNLKE